MLLAVVTSRLILLLSAAMLVLGAVGCKRGASEAVHPLSQRGYLWQRDWTPGVISALGEARARMSGVVVLGAEIRWAGSRPEVIRATVRWDLLRGQECAVALRMAPYPGPFAAEDAAGRTIAETARALLAEAAAQGVKVTELQVDFDCAQGKLAGYRVWIGAVRRVIGPMRLVITTLPSWLDEPEFLPLVGAADGYVLQVHSVPTVQESRQASLCDPALARKWVAKAARLGLPYSVALPTYRCLAGYGPGGKLLVVVMDSVKPAWPPDTRVLEFATNADEVAGLVQEWQMARPAGMQELIWYRIPVAADQYNWRWPTLAAVMAGRKPEHKLEVVTQGENPVDVAIANTGEAEEQFTGEVRASWEGAVLVASDALAGWTVQTQAGRAIFQPEGDHAARLSPGGKRSIGWLRYDKVPPLRFEITPGR